VADSDYPVHVTFVADTGQNRLWGIPIVGAVVRSILVIPHVIILVVVLIAVYVALLLNWVPVLVNGRQAGWVYTILGGYLRLYPEVMGAWAPAL
jgi:hypothetical protein